MKYKLLNNEMCFIFAGMALILFYIYSHYIIPLQDLPNWVYSSFLFKELLSSQVNNIRLVNYIPPNSITTATIGFLSFIMKPIYAGKLFLLIATSILYIGIAKFLKLYSNIYYLNYLIAFVLTFNFFYFHGYVHFILGSGLALLFIYKVRNMGGGGVM